MAAPQGSRTVADRPGEGELYWDRQQHCFHPASTAIPPLLRTAYREEPRWIDLRWYAGRLHRRRRAERSDPRFAERVADLAAAVRGVERDTLVGENVRQHQRALRLARGGVAALAVLLVLSIVAGVVAVAQRGEAVEQRERGRAAARSPRPGSWRRRPGLSVPPTSAGPGCWPYRPTGSCRRCRPKQPCWPPDGQPATAPRVRRRKQGVGHRGHRRRPRPWPARRRPGAAVGPASGARSWAAWPGCRVI